MAARLNSMGRSAPFSSDAAEVSFDFVEAEAQNDRPAVRAVRRDLRLCQLVQQPLHLLRSKRHVNLDGAAAGHADGDPVFYAVDIQSSFFRLQAFHNLLNELLAVAIL